MTVRIIPILAAAIVIGPSLAHGSPACMTKSEARAKFPNEVLYSHQSCWDNSAGKRSSTGGFATTAIRCGDARVPTTSTRGRASAFPTTRTRNR
jgi:hypothetical protein